MFAKVLAFSAVITAQPLVNDDVPEPSLCNEIEHALACAPTNAPTATVLFPFATNGISRSQLAIRLVSAQGADGRWTVGTNDVTSTAIRLLNEILD